MELMKINLLTHNDLDGIGCAIVAKYAAEKLGVPITVTSTSNYELEENLACWKSNIIRYADGGTKGTLNLITDLPLGSLAGEVSEMDYDEIRHPGCPAGEIIRSVMIVDHHIDSVENEALKFMNYECAVASESGTGYSYPECGTSLLRDYFEKYFGIDMMPLYEFVNIVRDWDTHMYPATKNKMSQRHNLLYFRMGWAWYEDYVLYTVKSGSSFANESPFVKTLCDRMVREVEIEVQRRCDTRLWDKTMVDGVHVWVIRADNKGIVSDLGALMSERHHAICMMVDSFGFASLRSTGDMDCNAIATIFGGGGHKNAAGCRVTKEQLRDIINGAYEHITSKD